MMRISEPCKKLVIRVPDHVHHLDPKSQFYEPERCWLAIEWPEETGQLTVHLMTYEESHEWLHGEDDA